MNEIEMIQKAQNIYAQCIAGDLTIDETLKQIVTIQIIRYHQLSGNTDCINNDSVLMCIKVLLKMVDKLIVSDILCINKYQIGDKYVPNYMIDYYVNHVISRLKFQNNETDIYDNEIRRKVLHDNILRYANEERGSEWSKILETFLDDMILEKL